MRHLKTGRLWLPSLTRSVHSSIVVGDEEKAQLEIAVFVDPATELAQRWAPIIRTLSEQESIAVRLYMNPALHLTDLPIKRFYASSFAPRVSFDPNSGAEAQPQVRFDDVPEDTLLTFATNLPNAWLAFPKESVYDLDNIRLADLPATSRDQGVTAVFELESLIIEGHAREMPTSAPPRGLQLELMSGSTQASAAQKHGE